VTPTRPRSAADRIFRALVRLFPFDFRADHGRDLEQTLRRLIESRRTYVWRVSLTKRFEPAPR